MSESGQESAAKRDKVVQIINSVVSKVEASDTISKEEIFHEVEALQNIINQVRSDLGGTGAAEINSKHIPTATDELDAIVEATAIATSEIMDACEGIQNLCEDMPEEKSEAIHAEIIKVYEACSFQDITGQRITKVVTSLHSIEGKVSHLLEVLAKRLPGIDYKKDEEPEGDDALLNGPQLANKGVTQAEIDALLDDLFD